MIIATSGYSYINYNRIISLSTSPYSVSVPSSKSFRDPSINSSRKLFGLYIIDQDHAVSLIYNGVSTDLAKINFQTCKIYYEPVFPKI